MKKFQKYDFDAVVAFKRKKSNQVTDKYYLERPRSQDLYIDSVCVIKNRYLLTIVTMQCDLGIVGQHPLLSEIDMIVMGLTHTYNIRFVTSMCQQHDDHVYIRKQTLFPNDTRCQLVNVRFEKLQYFHNYVSYEYNSFCGLKHMI